MTEPTAPDPPADRLVPLCSDVYVDPTLVAAVEADPSGSRTDTRVVLIGGAELHVARPLAEVATTIARAADREDSPADGP